MASNFDISFIIGLTDKFSEKMKGISASFTNTAQKMKQAGKTLSLAVTAPVALIGRKAIKNYNDFTTAMTNFKLTTGLAGKELAKFDEIANRVAKTSGRGGPESLAALQQLAKAGYTTAQVEKSIVDVEKLAIGTHLEMATAARLLTNVMSGFNIKQEDSAKTMDTLVNLHYKTKVSLADLSKSLRMVLPYAQAAGVSFEQLTALYASMADKGTEARAAGSIMTMYFRQAGKEQIQAMFKSKKSIQEFTKILNKSGIAEMAYKEHSESLEHALKQLNVAWNDMIESFIHGDMSESLKDIVKALSDLLNWVGSLSPEIRKTIAIMLALAAALGPVLIILGQLGLAIKFIPIGLTAITGAVKIMTGAVGILALKIAIITAGFIAWYKVIKDIKENWEFIKSLSFGDIFGGFKEMAADIASGRGYVKNSKVTVALETDANTKIKSISKSGDSSVNVLNKSFLGTTFK